MGGGLTQPYALSADTEVISGEPGEATPQPGGNFLGPNRLGREGRGPCPKVSPSFWHPRNCLSVLLARGSTPVSPPWTLKKA